MTRVAIQLSLQLFCDPMNCMGMKNRTQGDRFETGLKAVLYNHGSGVADALQSLFERMEFKLITTE